MLMLYRYVDHGFAEDDVMMAKPFKANFAIFVSCW